MRVEKKKERNDESRERKKETMGVEKKRKRDRNEESRQRKKETMRVDKERKKR